MPHLTYRDADGQEAALELVGVEVVIGRLPECDIVLPHNVVSRRHALVVATTKGWSVKDLGSAHGTFVNRLRVTEKLLEPGDEIRVGGEVLVFHDEEAPIDILKRTVHSGQRAATPTPVNLEITSGQGMENVPVGSPQAAAKKKEPTEEIVAEQPMASGKLMRASITARTLKELDLAGDANAPGEKAAVPAEERQFLRLVRITDVIARCPDANSVCRTAVALAMRATKADRGVLALREGGLDGEIVPRVQLVTVSDGAYASGDIEISSTFVEHAVSKQMAAVAADTGQNIDLKQAKSIVAMKIRSILCAPFGDSEQRVVGYLYLDSVGSGHTFSLDDLDLVSVIGYHAHAALQRLQLTDRIREEENRRRNLARFFSADVIKHIEQESEGGDIDPSLLVGEQTVTVLFSDIQGFATISEGMKAPALKMLLDEYFDRMTEILVDKHGGTLDKFIGDAIMALFGAPFTRGVGQDARAAVSAAIEMRDTLDKLRRELPEFRDVHARIGVNTGRVVAGMMGSKRRLEYSVIGDAVNVASRLESAGEAGKILIGEATYEAVKHQFECESAGERKVKNRAQPVKCWWVLRQRDATR